MRTLVPRSSVISVTHFLSLIGFQELLFPNVSVPHLGEGLEFTDECGTQIDLPISLKYGLLIKACVVLLERDRPPGGIVHLEDYLRVTHGISVLFPVVCHRDEWEASRPNTNMFYNKPHKGWVFNADVLGLEGFQSAVQGDNLGDSLHSTFSRKKDYGYGRRTSRALWCKAQPVRFRRFVLAGQRCAGHGIWKWLS